MSNKKLDELIALNSELNKYGINYHIKLSKKQGYVAFNAYTPTRLLNIEQFRSIVERQRQNHEKREIAARGYLEEKEKYINFINKISTLLNEEEFQYFLSLMSEE